MPLGAIYFPKLVIDAVESKIPLERLLLIIGIYFTDLFFLNLMDKFCQSKLDARMYYVTFTYQNKISEKYMRTDFSNTDDPKQNMKYSHAMRDACSGSNSSPEFIWRSLLAFFTGVLGIFSYGGLIVSISPIILILLLLSAVVTYFISRWQRKYGEKNKDNFVLFDRKIDYLSGFSSRFEYAKDIRIYGMLDWLNKMLSGF